MRTWVASILASLLMLAAPGAVPAAAPGFDASAPAPADATNWVVTLQPGRDPAREAPGLASAAGGNAARTYAHALRGFLFKGSANAAAALRHNPMVRTVVPDGPIELLADPIPTGVARIRANHATQPNAFDSEFTGAGVRVAILDTGIDLTHADLVANIDADLGLNCMTSGSPQDDHGHGTHVAGIVAAAANGSGVIGVAPEATLVPFKVLDSTGQGEWSNLLCAIDRLTELATDGDPTNDIGIANMSLGEAGPVGSCDDGFVREAICTSTAAGVAYVAAAGNSTVDTSTFIPAAFPEVIAVSAINNLDGEPGGLGGCWLIFLFCDDRLAEYSNFGSVVDVTAPGTQINSTWMGGGYLTETGTSMAAPHVAGVAALVRQVTPSLSPADVEQLLKTTGECPDQQVANPTGDCIGKGQWANDPDGVAEPLANALRAAQEAGPFDHSPTVQITDPADGSAVAGTVGITAIATDDIGLTSVEFLVNGGHLSTDLDGTDGWTASWDAGSVVPGIHTLTAVATDTGAHTASDAVVVSTFTEGTYVPLIPSRLLDTRFGTGLSGPFQAGVPRTFQVTGLGGVPANATGVTGNLTVTQASAGYAVFLGPNPTVNPTTSTLNFVTGQTIANGVTVALGAGGTLSATYLSSPGKTVALIFDVTGYFVPDTSGATYVPLIPSRLLDTRFGTGLSGPFQAGVPRTFQVTGLGGVPANATGVTGNLTVTQASAGYAVFLGPNPTVNPTTSTLNFVTGQTIANGVTVALGAGGTLSATYLSSPGKTVALIFDVTGYFVPDTSGATYVPLIPSRLLDTRFGTGLSGPFQAGVPRTFQVTGLGGVPANATGVTGNLTVTQASAGYAVFLGPNPTVNPTTSTLNFVTGQTIANGVTVALGAGGTLSATYLSSPGKTVALIFDVTGYFVP